MPSIAIFTPTRSSIKLFSRIYRELVEGGKYTVLHYDVVEEAGWFEKGLQYISLEYDRPRKTLKYRDMEHLRELVREVVESDEPDLAVLAGYSPATLEIIKILGESGVKTVHLEAGLRTYSESEEEYLRQSIDWSSHINLTPHTSNYQNLVREGFPKAQLYNVGSPLVDTALSNLSKAERLSSIMDELELTRLRYILGYTERRDPTEFVTRLGELSLKWDIDIVVPLTKAQKKRLIDNEIYYQLMTKYLLMPIEIQDYLDHLALINNARHIITDSSELALETAVLRKGVTIVDGSGDLYGLVRRGLANKASMDELLNTSLDTLKRRGGVDATKLFGGGESHIRIVEALEGFLNTEVSIPKWRGPLYSEGSG